MIQHVIIGVLFLTALVYVVYLIYQSFQVKSGCTSGCGKCGIDFNKIEKDLQKNNL